ncbi:MAG: heat-shock protein HtpX, partial [Gammaproteobacteria bacterium]|nr:heat-shock protein HtpX [Gammaproteobacteria bacterium]
HDLIQKVVPEAEQPAVLVSEQERRGKFTSILTGATGVLLTDSIIGQAGNPGIQHLDYAEAIRQQIPRVLIDAAHEPSAARAVIYYLVLNKKEPVRHDQLALLEDSADLGVYQELQALIAAESGSEPLNSSSRLPLVEIALPNLRQLSAHQYQLFRSNFSELIALDNKISLMEWALQKIIFHNLDAVFLKSSGIKLGRKELKNCRNSVSLLLSILAHSNPQQGISAAQAFETAATRLDITLSIVSVESIDYKALNNALDELASLKPLQKPALLKACAACITADKEVAAIEAELMRAIAATIDCPMPPIVA